MRDVAQLMDFFWLTVVLALIAIPFLVGLVMLVGFFTDERYRS